MKILLTNDDGAQAEGLKALFRAFAGDNTVMVAAPESQRSAVGHGISLHKPLRKMFQPNPDGAPWYAVSGTPADCVKLAILALFESRPDLVISGINNGENDGINTFYSGTVAGAREACFNGIPAMAVSMNAREPKHYQTGAVIARLLVDRKEEWGLGSHVMLNVNVPDLPLSRLAGVRFTSLDMAFPGDWVEKRDDPRGRDYYWYGYKSPEVVENSHTDRESLRGNYVSITPLKCDMTDHEGLRRLERMGLALDGNF
ncbi:MAG: 5'/3'-nucleotidase SurE [Desulfosudaceae bacterium]